MENPGKLNGDVTTAHHQYTLGQSVEEERFVGADRVLMARDLGDLWPATGGDQNVLGGVALTVDLNFMRPGQFGVTFH